jgi:hypothetical protein
MGRQGQDLSALFDKELQRQQRTNYENRSSSESRPDRDEGQSLLDRIRSLAERQEELSRRQRDMASARQGESDEVKRQLEVLRREQEALRQQLEELSRQVEQSASSGGQSGASGQSRSVNDAMRQATNEMRNATGELQRQSPGSAADRAERAAQGLRQAEQEMRDRSGNARDRAAGDARLEAQQIAGDQRRIAAEAARLAKGGDTETGDARRRLSAEQDQLADRVDALQRSLENLARTSRPPSGNGREGSASDAAAEVARELSRERIAERMRATARGQSGEPAGGQRPAEAGAAQAGAEQQIARTLDRLAERLGADSRSAADLSNELDRTRSIRDRLDRLERDLKAAEAKGSAGGLREEYGRELQSARETLERLQQGSTGGAHGGATPEQHEWSPVDKGTEAFKQDYSSWESLRKDIDSALDRYEASVIARAARKSLHDRLSTGGSEGVPDEYRRLIARYYESLARRK